MKKKKQPSAEDIIRALSKHKSMSGVTDSEFNKLRENNKKATKERNKDLFPEKKKKKEPSLAKDGNNDLIFTQGSAATKVGNQLKLMDTVKRQIKRRAKIEREK